MADLLYSNLHKNSFNFSPLYLPLNLSPPNFPILRFAPLRRRFSHSSLLAKLSSDSSQLHIISRTEHADGTVSFKFGDASEISQALENVDSVNGVELERGDSSILDNQAVTVVDDDSDDTMAEKIIVTSLKMKDIVSESSDCLVVEDEQDCNSSSIGEEVENSSVSLVDDELNGNLSSIEVKVENSSDSKAVKNDDEVVVVVVKNVVPKCDSHVDSIVDEAEELSVVSEELSDADEAADDDDKIENGFDESTSSSVSSEKLSDDPSVVDDDKIENGVDESSSSANVSEDMGGGDEPASSLEASDVAMSLKDENVDPELNADDKINNGGDESLSIISVEISDGGKLEYKGDESSKISELSSNPEASKLMSLKDDDDAGGEVELVSPELQAEPIVGVAAPSLGLENDKVADATSPSVDGHSSTVLMEEASLEASGINPADIMDSVNMDISSGILSTASAAASLTHCSEVMEADNWSIVKLDDDAHTRDISDAAPLGVEELGIPSETSFDREDSLDAEDESLDAASSPLSSEVNGTSPPNLPQSDGQHCSDNSQAAVSDPESSGISSDKVIFDSMEIPTVAHSMIPAAASLLDSTEVQDITKDAISESDDVSDVLLAVDPVTSEITSAETSLDSVNEMVTSAPAFFTSSAVASLSHSIEALAGGKDAYFVSEDWFGVADGVGQWSLEGVDNGLYAHELMKNCEKLLKSMNSGITNVKELLKQSDAMTESTGSARVIIAHIANQVLHVANIGDSGFVVIRNGIVFKKSSPMVHEFGFPYAIGLGDDSVDDIEEYQVELEDGDAIVTATDGLFDNLYEEEIAFTVSKALEDGMHVQSIAELLGTKAEEVGKSEFARSPFADAAQAAGLPGYNGGKHDHVTVIVSLVETR